MTSPRNTGVKERGGFELDAFSRRARRYCVYLGNAGVVKMAKKAFNKRVRKEWRYHESDS